MCTACERKQMRIYVGNAHAVQLEHNHEISFTLRNATLKLYYMHDALQDLLLFSFEVSFATTKSNQ